MNTLTEKEMSELEGGFLLPLLPWLGGAIAGGIISNALDNWPDFKQGFREGYVSTAN